jgi:hypothetical protein
VLPSTALQYGSAEAAAEAQEASKDRSRKSELQTVSRVAHSMGVGITPLLIGLHSMYALRHLLDWL